MERQYFPPVNSRCILPAALVAVFAVNAAYSQTPGATQTRSPSLDSLIVRLDAAQRVIQDAEARLDSLRQDLTHLSSVPTLNNGTQAFAPADSAIWREVLAEKRRRAELEAAFHYRRASLGYTFNPNLVLGMNTVGWLGDWGLKAEGRVSLVTERRALGGNLALLYSVHQFYLTGEEMFTRLYLFAGSGYYWERLRNGSRWYDVPDRAIRSQFGAGTELGLKEMHGTRFTPEIGFQHSRFFTRYQESEDFTGDSPRSAFSLYPYYALHINFYFL
jgi:hypothetical protein